MLEQDVNVAGVVWDGCASSNHKKNGGDEHRDLPCGTTEKDSLQVTVLDNTFLSDIGAAVCTDQDGDWSCGHPVQGEIFRGFCGGTFLPNYELQAIDTDSIAALVVYIDGPLFQPKDCAGTSNPFGGTWGTVSLWMEIF